jgi:hypothetical protein
LPLRDQYCPNCPFNITAMGEASVPEAFRRAIAEVLFVNRSSVAIDGFDFSGYVGGTCFGGTCNSPQMKVTFTVTVRGVDMDAYLSLTALLYAYYEAAYSMSYSTRNSLIIALAKYNFPNAYYVSQMYNFNVMYQEQGGFPTAAPTAFPARSSYPTYASNYKPPTYSPAMVWPTQAPITARPSSPNTPLVLPSSPTQNVAVANPGYGRMEEKYRNIAPPTTAAAGQMVYYRVKIVMFDIQNYYDWLQIGPTGSEPAYTGSGDLSFNFGMTALSNSWYALTGREQDFAYYRQYYTGSNWFRCDSEVVVASTTGITLHFRSYPNNYCYSYTYVNGVQTQVFCTFKGFKVEISQVGGVPTSAPTTFAPTGILLPDNFPNYHLPSFGTWTACLSYFGVCYPTFECIRLVGVCVFESRAVLVS